MLSLTRQIRNIVWDHRLPPMTATTISKLLRSDPASVSSILKKMTTKKIVSRAMKNGAWVYWVLLILLVPRPASAQITWTGPKLTPSEAAAVLANCTACLSNATNLPPALPEGGPTVVIAGSRPGALSWLDFPPERPARRLDGTLLSQPPTVYGLPPYWMPNVVLSVPNRVRNSGRNNSEHRGKRP